jgi:hypothetical protein
MQVEFFPSTAEFLHPTSEIQRQSATKLLPVTGFSLITEIRQLKELLQLQILYSASFRISTS